MSKTSQRRVSARSEARQRYKKGMEVAKLLKADHCARFRWYPNCPAWKKGFLDAGGIKFWGSKEHITWQ